jgi:hypothetical protein
MCAYMQVAVNIHAFPISIVDGVVNFKLRSLHHREKWTPVGSRYQAEWFSYCDVLPVNTSNNLWIADFVSRFIGYYIRRSYNHL